MVHLGPHPVSEAAKGQGSCKSTEYSTEQANKSLNQYLSERGKSTDLIFHLITGYTSTPFSLFPSMKCWQIQKENTGRQGSKTYQNSLATNKHKKG